MGIKANESEERIESFPKMERLGYSGVVLFFASSTLCQDDFGTDDAGADLDLESMMQQPGGTRLRAGGGPGVVTDLSHIEQTALALQQMGVVMGVIFLVAFLFLIMLGIERCFDLAQERYQEYLGKSPPPEADPASLVGTFKRYKN